MRSWDCFNNNYFRALSLNFAADTLMGMQIHKAISSLLILCLSVAGLRAQDAKGTSTVTFGVGGGWVVDSGLALGGVGGGPQFNGTYEFRILKYLALDASVDTTISTIPRNQNYAGYYSRTENAAFGFRGILPLAQGRTELFAGVDGAYLRDFQATSGMAIEPQFGFRVAVDKQKHFWLGGSARFVQNFGIYTGEWFTSTADIGFRFGNK
jgi:hypothetical protein